MSARHPNTVTGALLRVALAGLLAGCVNVPPKPALFKPLPRPMAAEPATYVAPQFQAFIPWQYAPGATNYCWTLQTSSNLLDWIDVPTGCLTGETFTSPTNPFCFFRMKGSP